MPDTMAHLVKIEAGLGEQDRSAFTGSHVVSRVLRKYLEPRITPRIRALLDLTQHLPGEERCNILRAEFGKKSATE